MFSFSTTLLPRTHTHTPYTRSRTFDGFFQKRKEGKVDESAKCNATLNVTFIQLTAPPCSKKNLNWLLVILVFNTGKKINVFQYPFSSPPLPSLSPQKGKEKKPFTEIERERETTHTPAFHFYLNKINLFSFFFFSKGKNSYVCVCECGGWEERERERGIGSKENRANRYGEEKKGKEGGGLKGVET